MPLKRGRFAGRLGDKLLYVQETKQDYSIINAHNLVLQILIEQIQNMLKKLKGLALSKRHQAGIAHTENQPLPSPPINTLGGLPEIRIQDEEDSEPCDSTISQACMTCSPLEAGTEQRVRKEHLLQSVGSGCAICSLFVQVWTTITEIDQFEYISTWTGHGGVFVVELTDDDDHDVNGGSRAAVKSVTIFLATDGESTLSPFPWLPVVTKSPFTRNQSRDIQHVSSWIEDCQENHSACQQLINPKLPTRVIDVGSDKVQPFLKITRGEEGKYLALSHRWGALDSQHKMLITKTKNIEQYCREIPLSLFPLTFRHAIEVCRSLGIQYIWIDSLCIIQDDIKDWEIEAVRMGDIFENSYATLFAERASHCDDGLFQTSEDKTFLLDWVQEISFQDPKSKNQHLFLVSWPPYYPSSLKETFCLVDKPISYLQNRGWVMQEEILSRRKICFSRSELHWQCKSMSQCECGLGSVTYPGLANDFTRNMLLTQRGDGSVTRGLSASTSGRGRKATDLNKAWMKVIEMYSKREFTKDRDKLTALAGVASKVGRPSENYLAGIWREDVSDQLLWHSWNQEGFPCHRYDPYYAPTWSWASLRGRVFFCSYSINKQVWTIIDGWSQPSGESPLGIVSSGTLRIQSKIAPVFVEEVEGNAPALDYSETYGLSQRRGIYENRRDGKTYHLVLRADTGTGNVTSFSSQHSTVFLDTVDDWKLFAGKPAQRYHYLIAQTGTNKGGVTLSEKISQTMGLLIRESAEKQGCWERICLLAPQGWWGDWSAIAEHKNILLI